MFYVGRRRQISYLFWKNHLYSKCRLWHNQIIINYVSDQCFLPQIWKLFAQCPKFPEIKNIHSKKLFSLKMLVWSRIMLLWGTGQKMFGKRAQTLLPKVGNWQIFLGVFREKKSLQMFFWTFRMQLTQCCGKTFIKNMKNFDQNPNLLKHVFFFEVNYLKKFLRATKCSFNKPLVNLSPEVERNVTQKAKMIKKNWSKIWKRLRRNTNCSLENPAKSFLSKFFCRKFSAKIQKPSLEFLKLSKTQSYLKKICLF